MKMISYHIGMFMILAISMGPAMQAHAQGDLVIERQVSLSLAHDAAHAAVERCRADGFRVSAAVVDRAGSVKALLRDDGAGPHTLDSSRRKAFTSSAFRTSTTNLVTRVAGDPALANLEDLTDGLLFLGGGLPILSGGEIVGGIGVGGAPSPLADEVCAQVGIDAISAGLEPADPPQE